MPGAPLELWVGKEAIDRVPFAQSGPVPVDC